MTFSSDFHTFSSRACKYSLYLFAFSLPFSKALISIFYALASLFFIIKTLTSPMSCKEDWKKFVLSYKPMIYFLIFCLLSLSWGNYFFTNLEGFFKYFRNFFLFAMVIFTAQDHKTHFLSNLIKFLLLGGLVTSCNGIVQHFSHHDLIRKNLSDYRIMSNFSSPTTFSAYLSLILPLPFLLFTRKNLKKNSAYGICFIFFALAFVFAYSRNVSVFFLLSIVGVFLIGLKLRFIPLLILFLVFSLSSLTLKLPRSHTTLYYSIGDFINSTSISERLFLWDIAFTMIQDKPILGQGLNSYSKIHKKYFPIDPDQMPYAARYLYLAYPHNGYLKMWIEIGLIGLLLYLSIYFSFLKTIFHAIYQSTPLNRFKICLYLTGFFTFILSSGFDTFLESTQTRQTFWLFTGMMMAELRFLKDFEVEEPLDVLRVPAAAQQT